MKLLVTGASGFLGEYVVAEALRCGYQVKALVRSRATLERKWSGLLWGHWQSGNASHLDIAYVDLRTGDGLADALHDIDAVIHLAAAKTGDRATQFADTVSATQTLLDEMERAGVNRLIAVSSFSVYDYLHQPEGALLEEHAPLERAPNQRDVYTQAKLQQEQLVRQFQTRCDAAITLLRPGIIFGPGALWPCQLGVTLGDRICLQIGNAAKLPLTYVENCADAIVKAAASKRAIGKVINVVDDERLTQQEFIDFLQQVNAETLSTHIQVPMTLGLPWTLMRHLARAVWVCDRLFGGRLPLPGILMPSRLHARFKSLDYSNYTAKAVLDWSPRYPFAESISRSLFHLNRDRSEDSLSVSKHSQTPQHLQDRRSTSETSASARPTTAGPTPKPISMKAT